MWLLSLFSVLLKYRKIIIINTLVVSVLAAAVSLALPKRYKARATILPPETETGFGGLMGLSTGLLAQAATNFALPIMATPSDLYASMLESESVLRSVVDSLHLQQVYGTQNPWQATAELRENLEISVEPEGIIKIQVEARDPVLAADIANTMTGALDRLNRSIRSQKGREFSEFLAKRLLETDSSLAVAADTLRRFQQKHGTIALDKQSEALITNLAGVTARLISSEVELELLRRQLRSDHPELIKQQMLVAELRHARERMEHGGTSSRDSLLSSTEIPLLQLPDLGLQLAVLTRNLKIFEMTYELLSQQLEMARLQERRDTPTVSVLDGARPPDRASWPRKFWIVFAAFSLTLILTISWAVWLTLVADPSSPAATFMAGLRDLLRAASHDSPK